MSESVLLEQKIERSNLRRINLFLRAVIFIHAGLLFTTDIFSYFSDLWEKFPSLFYFFIIHIVSIPFMLLCIRWNNAFINGKGIFENSNYLLLCNLLVFTPIMMVYYYWGLKDYSSPSVMIIYICILGFVLQLKKTRLIFMTVYFFFMYFGLAIYFRIGFIDNPIIFLNGATALVLYYVISQALYQERAKNILNEIAIKASNEKLADSNNHLTAELKSKLLLLNQNNDMLEKFNEIIKNRNSNPNTFADLKKLISSSTNESIIADLEEQFLEVHQEFIEELSKRFPNLTANNLKLCILIKLGLSTKEIAQLRYATPASVKVAKSRLRKSLDTDIDLFTFLNSLDTQTASS